MEPVTLVITDLDGTLLNSEKKVSEQTRQAIRQLKEHGILFGIASGRPVESGMVLCHDWGLDDSISFLLGMNGGVFYDTRLKQKETFADMDGELIRQIVNAYRDIPGLHFEVMKGNDRYVEWSSPETLANADLYGENEIIVDLNEWLKGRRVNKLIIRSTPEQQPMLAERAKKLNIPHTAAFSTSDVLFEFVNPEINKGFGLQQACRHFGLDLNHVVAFGDENNDAEMLMLAGTGVAMKNGTIPAKAAAKVISSYTNDEDALAHFLEENVLPHAEGKVEK